MQKVQQLANYLQLNSLDQLPALKSVQQKTTLKPSVLFIILSTFLIFFSLVLDITPLITSIGCAIIPGYFTFQVIGTKVEKQYIKYLAYWICFGLMEILVKPLVGFVFGSAFVMIFEIGLTFALLHPKFNLALILYDRFIRVCILKEEGNRSSIVNTQASFKRQQIQQAQTEVPKTA